MQREPSVHRWVGFCVRFVCGALLGLLLGGSLWLSVAYGLPLGWLLVIGCPIVFGLASAFYGDVFWLALRKWLWWGP